MFEAYLKKLKELRVSLASGVLAGVAAGEVVNELETDFNLSENHGDLTEKQGFALWKSIGSIQRKYL